MSDSNNVAIVTGASRGLGAVISRVLAERGYGLVIGGREEGTLARQAAALQSTGVRVSTVAGDLAEPEARERLAAEARRLGGLRVLVNNASELGGIRPVAELDLTVLGRLMRVNFGAPIALVQLTLPMLAESGGLIVNITSDAANGAYPGWSAYGGSKAALELVTRTLAVELRDSGAAAVTVDPGDMRTRLHQEAFPGEDISDRPLPDVTAPFWRWLFDQRPEDVNGQRFLAQQEDARWLQPA